MGKSALRLAAETVKFVGLVSAAVGLVAFMVLAMRTI